MVELELFLSKCELGDELRGHVSAVMTSMPPAVVLGLVGDAGFVLTELDGGPGRGGSFLLPTVGKKPVRAVVLKRRMWRRDEAFVRWVIAHELAHAHLNNRGRHEGEDPELAADALAAEWGFARPTEVFQVRK